MKSKMPVFVLLIQLGLWSTALPLSEAPVANKSLFNGSFSGASIGVWEKVSSPHGWLSSNPEKTETTAAGFIQLSSGVVVINNSEEKVSANTCYTLRANLGGSKGAIAKVALYATQNPDGTGKSVELVHVQQAGTGEQELSVDSCTSETVNPAIMGYYLQVELRASQLGVGYYGTLEIIPAPMEKEFMQLVEKGIDCVEFIVPVGNRRIKAMICSPPKERLDPDPVLLMAIGGASSNFLPSFETDQPAQYFWKCGHRAVSFSDPVFASLEGLRDSVLEGTDPFSVFIEDAQAVLKYCIDRKWARPGRIVVTGVSRFAYFAFRLMAADDQLNTGGGFSPVTDWRDLTEFHEQRNLKEFADLRLSCFIDKLAGKRVYLVIGNHDERVSTLSCCQFFLDLVRENQKRGFDRTYVDFFCTPDPDHRCGDEWYQRGMEILLNYAVSQK